MNTHAGKNQENESQSVVHETAQIQHDSDTTFQVADNRPEAVAQRKLQEMADNSPQAKQAAQLQAMANNHSAQQFPIQKKSETLTASSRENKTGLPDKLKTGIENLSGYSMDNVKVHYNSKEPAQLQAHAYAQGTDIHIASGQEKHLPHEAWHVVQQKQGRVKSTMQMKGKVGVNNDVGLEKEAHVMGKKAMQRGKTTHHSKEMLAYKGNQHTPVVQRATADQVEACLGKIKSPAAAAKKVIVDDLAETTGGKKVKGITANTRLGKVKKEVKQAAIETGYNDEAAERLVNQKPFQKEDIKTNSIIGKKGNVTSFRGFSSDGIKPPNHRFYFSNFYNEGTWTMGEIFRNPYLADFFSSDVIEEQKSFLTEEGGGNVGELHTLIQDDVVSITGVQWAKENKITNGPLSAKDLVSFLETENGLQSQRLVKIEGKKIVSGTISKMETEGVMAYKFFNVELGCIPME